METVVTQQKRWIARHVAQLPKSGIREFFELVIGVPDVISLGVGEPDFVTPWHIREAAIYALERGRTSYTSNYGLLRLREAISQHVARRYGVRYDPKTEILVTVGVSEAMDLALRALINPGEEVIYHEPCYVSYMPSIRLVQGIPKPVVCRPEDGFQLRAEAIEEAITPKTKALILNFPTNPTGAVMDRGELEKIAELAQRYDLVVITDEIYSDLTYEGKHVSIASLPGMRERTVFLHGFSKAYAMTGFRIGYACAPAEILEGMLKVHQYSMLCASIISQEAAIEALRNGEESAAEMKEEYRLRRNLIVSGLRSIGLECQMPRGAFYVFPSIRSTGLSSQEFAVRLLQEEKVACVPGTAFGPAGEGFLRCCYATSREQIEMALERINRFVQRLRRR